MAGPPADWTRAPVAFGRRAVPQLFGELMRPEAEVRLRALASLCGLMRDPERVYQAVRGGNGSMHITVYIISRVECTSTQIKTIKPADVSFHVLFSCRVSGAAEGFVC